MFYEIEISFLVDMTEIRNKNIVYCYNNNEIHKYWEHNKVVFHCMSLENESVALAYY